MRALLFLLLLVGIPFVNAEILFESDWSTDTGTNDSAIRDTGKARPWDAGTTATWSALEVVPATGLDFPTTNVLRIKRGPESGGYSWAEIQNIPPISIGESLYYRVYLRNDISDFATISNHHPIETAFGGAYTNGFSWKFGSNGDGTFPLTWNLQTTGNPFPLYGYAKGNPLESLGAGETYRLEWGVNKTAVDTYTIDVLVYDSSNTLLWNKTTVRAQGRDDNIGCNYCTLESVAQNRMLADSELTKFRVGTNGGTWSALTSEQYFYFGAVAICTNNWCGAYTSSTPEPETPEEGVCEATGSGRCFYIDPVNGNDNNDGSFAAPWRTGNNTKSTIYGSYRPPGYVQLQPGDIIYLMDGVHSTIINPGHDAGPTAGGSFVFYFRGVSGTEENPITLKAYPGHSPIIAPATQGIGIIIEYANHWRIENITIRDSYAAGLRLIGINGLRVSDLHIYDTDGIDNNNVAGIVTNGLLNAVFERLDMHDNFDRLAADTGGIGGENSANIVFFQGGNVTIRDSRFYHTRLTEQYQTCVKYKHGIPMASDWFEVYNNTFENCRIYGLATGGPNTHFHHNILKNGAGLSSNNLGSSTGFSVNILFEYNTLYNTTSGGFSFVPDPTTSAQFPVSPRNITYRNNIVYDLRPSYNGEFGIVNIGTYISDALYTVTLPELIIDNNCYYNPSVTPANTRFNFASAVNFGPLGALYYRDAWQALGFDTDSVFADPQFMNLQAGDFRLQQGSACSAMGAHATSSLPLSEPPPPALCEATGSGRCFYIDPVNGNDSHNGSFTAPWQTFDLVSAHSIHQRPIGWTAFQPGDVVYVRGTGILNTPSCYGNSTTANVSCNYLLFFDAVVGTEENPITVKSYPGERGVIGYAGTRKEGPFLQNDVFPAHYYVGGIRLLNSRHIIIEDLEITNLTGNGVTGRFGSDILIRNVTVHDTAWNDNGGNPAGVIFSYTDRTTVEDSTFYDNFWDPVPMNNFMRGEGVQYFQGGNQTIRNNFFYQTKRGRFGNGTETVRAACLMYKHGMNSTTSWFRVYNNTFVNCAGNAINTATPQSHIYRNLIINSSHAGVRLGSIAGSYYPVNFLFEYNTIVNGPAFNYGTPTALSSSPFPELPKNITYRNNIVTDTSTFYNWDRSFFSAGIYSADVHYEPTAREFFVNNNCYYNPVRWINFDFFAYNGAGNVLGAGYNFTTWPQILLNGVPLHFDAQSLHTDPLFVNPAAGDYRLQPGSPCEGKGVYGSGAAVPTRRVGDLNNDGVVDLQDVIQIVANFRRRSNYDAGADINNDGIVNVLDMVLLGRQWG